MAGLTREQRQKEAVYLPYLQAGKKAGCPPDQMVNFIKAGLILQEKQLEFAAKCRECDKPDGPMSVMFSGGRGSSKTHGGASQVFADDCQRFPGLKFLYLRKVGRANKEQIADIRKVVLAHLKHDYLEQKGTITFENGSHVILGNYKDEKDLDKYLGIEYDGIMIEEANQLSFSKQKNILSCLRTSKAGWRPRAYLLTNPGGVGHATNRKIYYEPWKEKREKETRFVHSTVLDNKFVNKEYLEYLKSLTGWQRKAWLEGSWDFMQGAFFSNFVEDVHVYPNKGAAFDERYSRRWFAAYDFGFAHNSACLLCGEDDKGVQFVVDEHCECEQSLSETIEDIKAMFARHHVSISDLDYFAAGRDCFSRDENGKTIANTFDEAGITLVPAEVDRINGWARLYEKFGDISKGIPPGLYVHQRCKNLIEQIQAAQHSEKRQGDIEKFNADKDGEGGDDCLDCCRFLVASDPSTSIKYAKPIAGFGYKAIGF
jgi:phage terminase large subunit